MKREIKWSSPKRYQPGYEGGKAHTAAKYPHGYCKKLKRKHEFEFKEEETIGFSNWKMVWHHYVCIGCGKKKFIDVKVNKDGKLQTQEMQAAS